MTQDYPHVTAFEAHRQIASGTLPDVAASAHKVFQKRGHGEILIFDNATSELIEVDFRGTAEDVQQRLTCGGRADSAAGDSGIKRGPGRPRLGVVGREVTLLPRHWEWLDSQPGGASVALRKLVEEAKRSNQGKDQVRKAQESVYRFMSAMTGNLPGFEEALRAFYGRDHARFHQLINVWPKDIRAHLQRLITALELLQHQIRA